MADKYVSNNVPHSIPGGVVTFKNADGSILSNDDNGKRVIETFTPRREGVLIERPNAFGAAGGFVLAGAAVEGEPIQKQEHGSTAVQLPKSTSLYVDIGMYFDITFSSEAQRWVVHTVSPPFASGQYIKQNVELIRDHYAVIA